VSGILFLRAHGALPLGMRALRSMQSPEGEAG
jgi:hypothetical protein